MPRAVTGSRRRAAAASSSQGMQVIMASAHSPGVSVCLSATGRLTQTQRFAGTTQPITSDRAHDHHHPAEPPRRCGRMASPPSIDLGAERAQRVEAVPRIGDAAEWHHGCRSLSAPGWRRRLRVDPAPRMREAGKVRRLVDPAQGSLDALVPAVDAGSPSRVVHRWLPASIYPVHRPKFVDPAPESDRESRRVCRAES